MNISSITNQLLCSGCGTCNTICGQKAISMRKSPTMGLLYAAIESEKCTDCGLCIKVCPSNNALIEKEELNVDNIVGTVKGCYVGRSSDKKIYNNAQSGGVATTILSFLFDRSLIDAAICCRMEPGLPVPEVHYQIITSAEALSNSQKSCYTQVDIVSALNNIDHFKSVAVVGVPCHIRGIINLMQFKKFGNISYRIGLICDKSYADTYMEALIRGEKKAKVPITIQYKKKNFSYEGKYYSYQEAPTVINSVNGNLKIISRDKRIYLKDQFAVPKCKICWDKLNVHADIVLGDPWGLEGRYDKNTGDSVIVVRTDKAASVLEKMESLKLIGLTPTPLDEVVKGQLIKERVSSIRSINWNGFTQTWRRKEQLGKDALLKKVSVRYKLFKLKNKVFKILSRIKQQITK